MFIALSIAATILIYLSLSIIYGILIYYFEKNSAEKVSKQSPFIGECYNYVLDLNRTDKHPVLTSISLILLAIIFSGASARFIKGGSWIGGASGFEDEIEDIENEDSSATKKLKIHVGVE